MALRPAGRLGRQAAASHLTVRSVPAVSTPHLVPATRFSRIRSPATINRSLHTASTTAALVPSDVPAGNPSWRSLRSSSATSPVEMSSRLSTAEYQSSSPGCSLVIASTCPGPDQAASRTFSPSGETLASSPEAGGRATGRARHPPASRPRPAGTRTAAHRPAGRARTLRVGPSAGARDASGGMPTAAPSESPPARRDCRNSYKAVQRQILRPGHGLESSGMRASESASGPGSLLASGGLGDGEYVAGQVDRDRPACGLQGVERLAVANGVAAA